MDGETWHRRGELGYAFPGKDLGDRYSGRLLAVLKRDPAAVSMRHRNADQNPRSEYWRRDRASMDRSSSTRNGSSKLNALYAAIGRFIHSLSLFPSLVPWLTRVFCIAVVLRMTAEVRSLLNRSPLEPDSRINPVHDQ